MNDLQEGIAVLFVFYVIVKGLFFWMLRRRLNEIAAEARVKRLQGRFFSGGWTEMLDGEGVRIACGDAMEDERQQEAGGTAEVLGVASVG